MPDQGAAPIPTGVLRLTVQKQLLGPGGRGPWVGVDGFAVEEHQGSGPRRIEVELTAGPHRVEVEHRWHGDVATCTVDVTPGSTTELWYAAPVARAFSGRIGSQPQPDQAARYLWLLAAIVAVGLVVTLL